MTETKNLPTFLIIGAQKAGTTTLHNALVQHPEIYMPEDKELNFYFKDELFKKGLKYYETLFRPKMQRIIGEASPGYLCHPLAPKRIFETNENIKIICILRNPVDRAYSQFWDNKRHLTETASFEAAFAKYRHYDHYMPGKIGYFTRGFYADQLERYYNFFPPENIMLLKTEDLKENFSATIRKCQEFLGVNDLSYVTSEVQSNESYTYKNIFYQTIFRNRKINRMLPYSIKKLTFRGKVSKFRYPKMEENIRRQLTLYFRKYNEKLEKITQLELSDWKE